ncbi:MAG TPA: Gfo/Idh/MocA family oxidoreductase [Acidobacteriota bacterium]|nr:Gfo/Idh/MocA family oxidoreductase [Acidobacteriota bacterium]
MPAKVNIGLLGVGRLGRSYARSLAGRVPGARLAALGDPDRESAQTIADELDVSNVYAEAADLIADPGVDAVVIVSPTHTHRELVETAASERKPIFCEKPLALSLQESEAMQQVVERSGVFFQMGFMRRFDRGYRAAREKIEQGLIGKPVVFKSSSRDPFRPSLEYLHPDSSGGIFIDMGIHDIDLSLWLFGRIETVYAVGAVLAYPEVESVGDFDNAVLSLIFADGRLGIIDLSRNGVYGYDICTDILGTEGTLKVGYLRETPILHLTKNNVSHDVVPYFPERFGEAYVAQLDDFVQNLRLDRPPPVTVVDGVEALRVAVAATRSSKIAEPVEVDSL